VTTPAPESGVFRWSWHRARQYRATFLVGGFLFSCVAAAGAAVFVLPAHATTAQKVLAAIVVVVAATVLTCIGTYAVALLTALYQQRNALRAKQSDSDRRIAELEATPVSQTHGDRLRQIAEKLSECLRVDFLDWIIKSPDVARDAYGEKPGTWRKAFCEHFPELGPVLDKIAKADTAWSTFGDRVRREAELAGMGKPPWLLDRFAVGLARPSRERARRGLLEKPFDFDWHEAIGWAYVGDPNAMDRGLPIFDIAGAADPEQLKRTFEEFMSAAEAWPEARNIMASWHLRNELLIQAAPLLATAANTDPITNRCSLCRGSG
jgi:hypothetical protein